MPMDCKCTCGAVLSLDEGQRGTEVECPQCSRRFTLPEDFASEAGPERQPRYVAWLVGVGVAAAFLLVGMLVALPVKGTVPNVIEMKKNLITVEKHFQERVFKYREVMDAFDPATGYWLYEGKWWGKRMSCASSEVEGDPHYIPVPPRPVGAEKDDLDDDAPKPYPCPICGKEANPYVLFPHLMD